nr:MAG TPA: hypothetical protein [Caudoviricetes sp.]
MHFIPYSASRQGLDALSLRSSTPILAARAYSFAEMLFFGLRKFMYNLIRGQSRRVRPSAFSFTSERR